MIVFDEEIFSIAKRGIDAKGIKNRNGLLKEGSKLHRILLARKLLDAAFADDERPRTWDAVREVVKALGEL